MPSFRLRRHVDAPVERVFACACDFAAAPGRIRSVLRVELLTPAPIGPGTRLRQTRRLLGREVTQELQLVAFDPPHGFSLGFEDHGCRFESRMTFAPAGGGTGIELRLSATPLTAPAKLMSAALEPLIGAVAQECERDLDDLQAAVEAGG
jgi:hypothetical protein